MTVVNNADAVNHSGSHSASPIAKDVALNWQRRARAERLRWAILISLPPVLTVVAVALFTHVPTFYRSRIADMDAAEQKVLSKEFLNRGTRWINDMHSANDWRVEFGERHINAWLADDFENNHAEQSLPAGISAPRVAVDGDILRLGFRYSVGPMTTVVQLGVRTWVPKRNLLAVELLGARAGGMPLPTNHTRHVIEQFCNANGMDVRWKRKDKNLVGLISFSRGPKEFVLRKVQIANNALSIVGSSHRAPAGDYAPSAN